MTDSSKTRENIEKFVLEQFNETLKRYESYDQKTRSILFLDKLHLCLAFIMNIIASEESQRIEREEAEEAAENAKSNCGNVVKSKKTESRKLQCEQLKKTFELIKNELNALEKHVMASNEQKS